MKPSSIFWLLLCCIFSLFFIGKDVLLFLFIAEIAFIVVIQITFTLLCFIFNDFEHDKDSIHYYNLVIKYNIFYYLFYYVSRFNNYLNEKFS